MLHEKLINPSSIVVIGGSDHIDHIGGSVLKNLIDQGFDGQLYVVNPKKDEVQGIHSFRDVSLIPPTDLAIIAIPAQNIPATVKELVEQKRTKGFIIYSAGFSELGKAGKRMEQEITRVITAAGASLLGPNNIGLINQNYAGIFTRPVPLIYQDGVDFISASGATAVFTIEAAQQLGLRFSSLITVGNSAQIGVEEVLEHFDNTFESGKSSLVKLLYLEGIKQPEKLLRHALSLREKGCILVGLKSGNTAKGNVAAASHTGAIANSDLFVQSLFEKAGIIRCHSRYELITIGAILQVTRQKPKNFAVITHAGGPGVIATDTLTQKGLSVPDLSKEHQDVLSNILYPGAATINPIDMLATGTALQLGQVISYCEKEVNEVDAMIVIFGSPGLGSVSEAYRIIHDMIQSCRKPIFAILPSVVNVQEDIKSFISKGHIAFSDEYLFAQSLSKTINRNGASSALLPIQSTPDKTRKLRDLVRELPDGYMAPEPAYKLMTAAGITMPRQAVVNNEIELSKVSGKLAFPMVQKVIGPLHKSDKKGVILNVLNPSDLLQNYRNLMQIEGVNAILIQEMNSGKEVFIGAKREAGFPPLIMCGAGGVYIEVLKDYQSSLAPLSKSEVIVMVNKLKIKPILEGIRGEPSCDLEAFYEAILNISTLMLEVPEILELDLNPLIITPDGITAVDARIKIATI